MDDSRSLLVFNTVGVVLFQVRVARRVSGLDSASRLVRHAGAIMLASCSRPPLLQVGALDLSIGGSALLAVRRDKSLAKGR